MTNSEAERARHEAMAALRAWARQGDGTPTEQTRLLANAWRTGTRDVNQLAAAGNVARQTVHADLKASGIDVTAERDWPPYPPRFEPLDRETINDLADQMVRAFGPSTNVDKPDPLVRAGWHATKFVDGLAALLGPTDPDSTRLDGLIGLADCVDTMRRHISEQIAAENGKAELLNETNYTEDLDHDDTVVVARAQLSVILPDGSPMTVTVDHEPAESHQVHGWLRWTTDNPLPLAAVDNYRHIVVKRLLRELATVITDAIHPDLLTHEH